MTGPEHYREAERLVRLALRHTESSDALVLATAAQAHATLALAAATALVDETPRSDSFSEYRVWQESAGSPYVGPEGDS
ncbi:hypothetical protein [Streptomyces abikoensis]|uniref:HEPN domain-containing protein n=1 Tax=Streptomyces abikoensis TaxID=97398 RepID=A0ABW7TCD6_9ACTN|nr:hypothetical protein [Streptomyces abikoensis]GGP55550.1 hypothetical protein GCM10010214_30930 [Streptomyces abikoensis]